VYIILEAKKLARPDRNRQAETREKKMNETLAAIKKIENSKANEDMKTALCLLVSEFNYFMQIKRKHKTHGLMKACYAGLGVKFIGLYSINTVQDCIRKAESNNLLA